MKIESKWSMADENSENFINAFFDLAGCIQFHCPSNKRNELLTCYERQLEYYTFL